MTDKAARIRSPKLKREALEGLGPVSRVQAKKKFGTTAALMSALTPAEVQKLCFAAVRKGLGV